MHVLFANLDTMLSGTSSLSKRCCQPVRSTAGGSTVQTFKRAAPVLLIRPNASQSITEAPTNVVSDQDVHATSSLQQQPGSSDAPTAAEDVWDYSAPQHVLERNNQFIDEQLRGRVILAPLTKGGNLPFRCAGHGRNPAVLMCTTWLVCNCTLS